MQLSIVVAVAENGVIGAANQLPWHLPADLQHFKALTLGKPMVMGRKTYESIGRPLPGRTTIVVSRDRELRIAGCQVVESLAAALRAAEPASEVMIVGGADIFRLALPATTTIHLTRVHAQVAGDVFFPALDPGEWRETQAVPHAADERHAYAFTFVTLQRDPR